MIRYKSVVIVLILAVARQIISQNENSMAFVGEIDLPNLKQHLESIHQSLKDRKDFFVTMDQSSLDTITNLGSDLLNTWKICILKADPLVVEYARMNINSALELYGSSYTPIIYHIKKIVKKAIKPSGNIISTPDMADEIMESLWTGFMEGITESKNLLKTKNLLTFTAKVKTNIEILAKGITLLSSIPICDFLKLI